MWSGETFFDTRYGLLPNGAFRNNLAKPKNDGDDVEEELPPSQEEMASPMTTSSTWGPLHKLLNHLMSHRWDACLQNMVGGSKGRKVLDLSLLTSYKLNSCIEQIVTLYKTEFTEAVPPPTRSITIPSATGASSTEVFVEAQAYASQAEYEEAKKEYNASVENFEKDEAKKFISSRVQIIVASLAPDSVAAVRALSQVPIMSERRRKLFLDEEALMSACPWEDAKRRKLNPLSLVRRTLSGDDLQGLCDVYAHFRSLDDDGKSQDICMCTLAPSTNPDTPVNASLTEAHGKFKKLSPKHATLKIGEIRTPLAEEATNRRNANGFSGIAKRPFLWTSQSKLSYNRGPMNHLVGGHTYVNEWPVPFVPLQSLPRVPSDSFAKLFAFTPQDAAEDPEAEPADPSVLSQVASLGDGFCIPYPLEIPPQFFFEIFDQLGAQIFVTLRPGMGNGFKAHAAGN